MVSKAQQKLIHSLEQKKYRKIERLFVAEGAKIADECLKSSLSIVKIYALASWINSKSDLLGSPGSVDLIECTEDELKQISFLSTPQSVLMLISIPEEQEIPKIVEHTINLALESIRDPGNMGTIIRLADWYGITEIYCSTDCVDIYSPKVVQASMGSLARVKVYYTDLGKMFDKLQMPIYAATLGGDIDVHQMQSIQKSFLLIGNEGAGISKDLLEKASHTITIPRFGHAESLNAAIATGILLDNFKRLENTKA